MASVFLDTNVFLYAASQDPAEAQKAVTALALIRGAPFGVSVQVLQEFYVNATGRLAKNIPRTTVDDLVTLLKEQEVVGQTVEIFDRACDLAARYQISYWDAAIIAAAKELGANTIYSEDMAHGQKYDGIQVVNPFVQQPAT